MCITAMINFNAGLKLLLEGPGKKLMSHDISVPFTRTYASCQNLAGRWPQSTGEVSCGSMYHSYPPYLICVFQVPVFHTRMNFMSRINKWTTLLHCGFSCRNNKAVF